MPFHVSSLKKKLSLRAPNNDLAKVLLIMKWDFAKLKFDKTPKKLLSTKLLASQTSRKHPMTQKEQIFKFANSSPHILLYFFLVVSFFSISVIQ